MEGPGRRQQPASHLAPQQHDSIAPNGRGDSRAELSFLEPSEGLAESAEKSRALAEELAAHAKLAIVGEDICFHRLLRPCRR